MRAVACALALALLPAWTPSTAVHAAEASFLNDDSVRETIVGHTLKGVDWIEYYTADGAIFGKVRYFGIRPFTGTWSVRAGKVCYDYGRAEVNTCSWLRRDGDKVTHHHQDGRLKKDGTARRFQGNRLDDF